jgi:hypothetical protein
MIHSIHSKMVYDTRHTNRRAPTCAGAAFLVGKHVHIVIDVDFVNYNANTGIKQCNIQRAPIIIQEWIATHAHDQSMLLFSIQVSPMDGYNNVHELCGLLDKMLLVSLPFVHGPHPTLMRFLSPAETKETTTAMESLPSRLLGAKRSLEETPMTRVVKRNQPRLPDQTRTPTMSGISGDRRLTESSNNSRGKHVAAKGLTKQMQKVDLPRGNVDKVLPGNSTTVDEDEYDDDDDDDDEDEDEDDDDYVDDDAGVDDASSD